MNMKFPEPELVQKTLLRSNRGREIEFRIYRTPELKVSPLQQPRWWWHFGFPEALVSSLCPLLECTPYWGDQHWAERDGYWIWATSVVSDSSELSAVQRKLNSELRLDLQSLNMCLSLFYKTLKRKEKREEDGPEAIAD